MSISARNFDYSAARSQFRSKLQSLDLDHDGRISFAEAQKDASIFSMFNGCQPSGLPISINDFESVFSKKIQHSTPDEMDKMNCSAQTYQNGVVKDSRYESNFFNNLQTDPISTSCKTRVDFNS